MSDTPRTDAAYTASTGAGIYELFQESKDIERELNKANERIKNLKSALCTVENIDKVNVYQDLESTNERIKRLEEAGDAMVSHAKALGMDGTGLVQRWNKAKETKL
jgi:predicted  nucleic acid-binding Zn-ribbon protein